MKKVCAPIKDEDGFISNTEKKPRKFSLCLVKPVKGKEMYGWWTGRYWDGLKRFDDHEVLGWKIERREYEKTEQWE